MNNDTQILLTNALLTADSRKEIFTALQAQDFKWAEDRDCFNDILNAWNSHHTFDSSFTDSLALRYPNLIDYSLIIADWESAITTRKTNALKQRVSDLMVSATHIIQDPATTSKQVMDYCKDIYNESTTAVSLFDPIPSFNQVMSKCLATTEAVREGRIKYKTFGVPCLDGLKFTGGDLIVLAARPAVGKTAIGLDCCRYSASKGQSSAFVCLETDSDILTWRLISQESNIPYYKIAEEGCKNLTSGEQMDYMNAVKRLQKLPINVISRYKQTVTDLYSICKQLKAQGVEFIFIDYLQKVKPSRGHKNRFEAVAEISSDLKDIACELDIVIVALTQLNRDADNTTPRMSQLAESSRIEQDATTVVIIDRPDATNPPPERDYKHEGGKIDMRGLIALNVVKSRNSKKPIKFVKYDFSCFKLLEEVQFGQPRKL